MPNGHTSVGHIAVDEVLDLLQVVYPAAHDIGLSVTAHLKVYGVGNGLSAERREHGLDGVTVWWGSAHDAHVACSHERELQRAGYGRCRHGERVDIGLELAQLLLRCHAKLLLLVNDEQSEVFPHHALADELMRAYQDVDLAVFQVFEHLLCLLCRAGAGEVVDSHGEIFQSRLERLEVLVCQHRCGHEHRHLLRVACRLEGSSYRHLRLAEPHIATHQTVHGFGLLHVGLHVLCRFQLVGRVFIKEAGLELMLHERVAAEGEAFLVPAFGVELYQVAGNVLDLLLGLFLKALPCSRTEGAQTRCLACGAAAILAYLVERVYAHIHDVAALVNYAYDLLVGVAHRHTHQSAKLADAKVDMHDKIARIHLLQLFHGERHLARPCCVALQTVLMETVKDLMVGEEASPYGVVGKALVQRVVHGCEGQVLAFCLYLVRVENVAQTTCLLLAVSKDVNLVAHEHIVGERPCEQLKVFVKQRLRRDLKRYCCLWCAERLVTHVYSSEGSNAFLEACAANQLCVAAQRPHDLFLLLFCGALQALCHSLLRKSFVVDACYCVGHISQIFHSHNGVGREETGQGHLLLRHLGKLWHNLHRVFLVLRQLILNVECAYGVDLVAEEVDTER